jgi:hypothetical protein
MKPTSFQLVRVFFLFSVAVLIMSGVVSLVSIIGSSENTFPYSFYSLLMFGDAAIMFYCAWELGKRTKPILFFSSFMLLLNILLIAFDWLGQLNLRFGLFVLFTLFLLISVRKEFLPA